MARENATCCVRTVYIHRELCAILGADETSGAVAHGGHDLHGCARPRDGVSASLLEVDAGAVVASEEEAIDVLELRLLQRLRALQGCDVARLFEPFVMLTGVARLPASVGTSPPLTDTVDTLQPASLKE